MCGSFPRAVGRDKSANMACSHTELTWWKTLETDDDRVELRAVTSPELTSARILGNHGTCPPPRRRGLEPSRAKGTGDTHVEGAGVGVLDWATMTHI